MLISNYVNINFSVQMVLFFCRCAGTCAYEGRGGLCSITLSQPLLKLRPRKDLVETLLVRSQSVVRSVHHNCCATNRLFFPAWNDPCLPFCDTEKYG